MNLNRNIAMVGEFISSAEVSSLSETYREQKLSEGFDADKYIRSELFGVELLKMLLNQPGVVALRIHYGLKTNDEDKPAGMSSMPRLFLTGVDWEGNDVLQLDSGSLKDESSSELVAVLANGATCPPFCSPDNHRERKRIWR